MVQQYNDRQGGIAVWKRSLFLFFGIFRIWRPKRRILSDAYRTFGGDNFKMRLIACVSAGKKRATKQTKIERPVGRVQIRKG